MRFVLFFLFFGIWSTVWWWHYSCHIKEACCPQGMTEVDTYLSDSEFGNRPVLHLWSDPTGYIGPAFEDFRDSLLESLSGMDTLRITGLYFLDEENPTEMANLGLARAQALSNLFPSLMQQSRLQTSAMNIPLQGDFKQKPFEALHLAIVEGEEKLVERDGEQYKLLYFPYNSTRRFEDPELSSYLKSLAARLIETGESIHLTGHADDVGNNNSNYYLGLWRAGAVKDFLIEEGVDADKIQVFSKGEIEPIATNNTPEGKGKNRRVEVQILNKE